MAWLLSFVAAVSDRRFLESIPSGSEIVVTNRDADFFTVSRAEGESAPHPASGTPLLAARTQIIQKLQKSLEA